MMSRKHYVMIAERIARNAEAGMDVLTLSCLAQDLACDFAQDNPAFDRTRFLKACGAVEMYAELVKAGQA